MNKVDEYLNTLPEWQMNNLNLFRKLIRDADPSVTEDIKWNVPVFMINNKMHFTMAGFKEHTKFNFITNGATIADAKKLFNNGLESKKSRSIDLRQGETIDAADLTELIKLSLAS
ncbi:MAG: hypothetical protein JWN75_628 [Candidatus Saccharibacteria bacterium]|nr:hypothetical protein [Candidatus Saccharibacteria bacterium]